MKSLHILFLCLISVTGISQKVQKSILFQDSFDNNSNNWSVTTLNDDGYESYLSSDGRYVCNLPINNPMRWGWTYVGVPGLMVQSLNNEESVELDFDWQVLQYNQYHQICLMFDLHNVSPENNCPGGDFRAIWLTYYNGNISTAFSQTRNCNQENEWRIDGDAKAAARETNHCKLVKSGYNYNVYINGVRVLTFDYKGPLNLSRLNYGKGICAFDNFKVSRRTFVLNPVSSAPVITSNKPKIWILLAGIEKYDSKPLTYTVDDIAAMYNFWTSSRGGKVPSNQIKYLPDNYATSDNILGTAQSLFSQATEDDIIITFLSGHGGVGAFSAYNGSLQYEYLNKTLKQSRARKKICIIDACHAGSFNSKGVLKSKGETLDENQALNLFYTSLSRAGNGITYLLACRADQLSREDGSLGHGVFTYFLLRGLQGAADQNSDKLVTIKEVVDYLDRNVPAYQNDQNPVIKGTFDPDTPLAVLSN